MSYQDRVSSIEQLEQQRGSRILTYVTGDRPGGGPSLTLPLNIEPTVVPVIHEALRSIGSAEAIDLFLYTRGGAVDVVWPIVSLIREFASERFTVIVPFRAHSAGTLIVLGADRVVMCSAAELTSVDPTTGNVFNPLDELSKGSRKGVSVEDVAAYFQFARENEKVKLKKPAHVLEAFKSLTGGLHPLALGHVQRIHTQIRFLAEKLLDSRRTSDTRNRNTVVETLTEKLYSHTHAVNRHDARELLGDSVEFPPEEEATLIWSVFEEYSAALKLREPQNLFADLGGSQQASHAYARGFVETTEYSSVYETEANITAASKAMDGAIYSQKSQKALNDLEPSEPGLPTYVAGLPPLFSVDIVFEGWRKNTRGV